MADPGAPFNIRQLLTPPVISRLPLGLLRFLGIQSGGSYPQSLATNLQTTFDQLELLHGNHRENIQQGPLALAVAGAGVQFTALQVPQAEVWYVRAASCRVVSGAGEGWTGQLIYQPALSATGQPEHALTPLFQIGASETRYAGSLQNGLTGGLFMGPGDTFSMWTSAVTGSIDSIVYVQITRYPI